MQCIVLYSSAGCFICSSQVVIKLILRLLGMVASIGSVFTLAKLFVVCAVLRL